MLAISRTAGFLSSIPFAEMRQSEAHPRQSPLRERLRPRFRFPPPHHAPSGRPGDRLPDGHVSPRLRPRGGSPVAACAHGVHSGRAGITEAHLGIRPSRSSPGCRRGPCLVRDPRGGGASPEPSRSFPGLAERASSRVALDVAGPFTLHCRRRPSPRLSFPGSPGNRLRLARSADGGVAVGIGSAFPATELGPQGASICFGPRPLHRKGWTGTDRSQSAEDRGAPL